MGTLEFHTSEVNTYVVSLSKVTVLINTTFIETLSEESGESP